MTEAASTGRIAMHARAERMLEADGARLSVRVEGETAFFGNAALTRSREVAALVNALKGLGLEDADLRVVGVSLKTQSGTIGRSSRASFTLEAAVRDLERLPDLLGTVSSAKNAELLRLEWLFSGEEEAMIELIGQATLRAQAKARAAADALGLSLGGLHRASVDGALPASEPVSFHALEGMALSRSRSAPLETGAELRGRKALEVQVSAEFEVGGG